MACGHTHLSLTRPRALGGLVLSGAVPEREELSLALAFWNYPEAHGCCCGPPHSSTASRQAGRIASSLHKALCTVVEPNLAWSRVQLL